MLADVQIVEHHLDGLMKGFTIGQKVAPFAGNGGEQHIDQTINCKEPT